MILLLGPKGVGKSILVKQLDDPSQFDTSLQLDGLPSAIPTVGIDFKEFELKEHSVTVKEVGSAVMPLWPSQVNETCTKVMFMVDVSNRFQIAASCVQLLSVLGHELLVDKSTAIILNKCDVPDGMSIAEITSILRLDDLLKSFPINRQPKVFPISAARRQGVEPLIDWMIA